MKLLDFHNDETVTQKYGFSNADSTKTTVACASSSGSGLTSDKPDAVKKGKKLQKTKTTISDLGSDNPSTIKKSVCSKINEGDLSKLAKKSKRPGVEPKLSGGLKVKKSAKSKHLKSKHVKDTVADS